MADLFLILFFISFICLIVGLINPSVFARVIKREVTRKKIGLIFGVALLVFFILTGATHKPKENVGQPIQPEETIETVEKEVQVSEVEPTPPTTVALPTTVAPLTTLPTPPTTVASTPTTLPTPLPEPAKEWIKVIELTVDNNRQSETFQLLGGQQRLSYSISGDAQSEGMCLIYVMEEGKELLRDGGFPVIWGDGDADDETLMRKGRGYYYLNLQVGWGSCSVEIYELR